MEYTFTKEVREAIRDSQYGYCANCLKPIDSFHHKLHNTKSNQQKFSLFLHSIFNCVGLCELCHRNKSHLFEISERLAKIYEEFLKKLKRK